MGAFSEEKKIIFTKIWLNYGQNRIAGVQNFFKSLKNELVWGPKVTLWSKGCRIFLSNVKIVTWVPPNHGVSQVEIGVLAMPNFSSQ